MSMLFIIIGALVFAFVAFIKPRAYNELVAKMLPGFTESLVALSYVGLLVGSIASIFYGMHCAHLIP